MNDIFRVDFYAKDWLLDTQVLTPEERGIYITIVSSIYHRGEPVLDDEKWLSNLCNCSRRKLSAVKSNLIDRGFIEIIDGKITQKRAEEELLNARSRRKTARKSNENRMKTDRKQLENQSKTSRKIAENERVSNEINDLTLTRQQTTDNRQQSTIKNNIKSPVEELHNSDADTGDYKDTIDYKVEDALDRYEGIFMPDRIAKACKSNINKIKSPQIFTRAFGRFYCDIDRHGKSSAGEITKNGYMEVANERGATNQYAIANAYREFLEYYKRDNTRWLKNTNDAWMSWTRWLDNAKKFAQENKSS